jgi:ABC-type polysaccharide/polyol phosphate transport system ATPase subunit
VPALSLDDVSVDFPLYDARYRSIKWAPLDRGRGEAHGLGARALDGVSLAVEAGRRIAVFGGNSSGKTTLLRVLAGLLQPGRGRVARVGRVGAVFSMGFGFDPEARLKDLAYAQGLLMGVPAAEARGTVPMILDFAGIDGHADTPALVVPPGLLFRLAMATILCFDADIVLLDEVLDIVDPEFLAKVEAALSHPTRADTIVMMAERSRLLAQRFCTEALVLDHGRLVETGPVSQVLAGAGAAVTF